MKIEGLYLLCDVKGKVTCLARGRERGGGLMKWRRSKRTAKDNGKCSG